MNTTPWLFAADLAKRFFLNLLWLVSWPFLFCFFVFLLLFAWLKREYDYFKRDREINEQRKK